MGTIVIRTRYDEGTESAEVATHYNTGISSIVQIYNTGITSIVIFTILVFPALWIIPESLIYAQYRKLQYSSSNNTGNTSIVKHTMLEAPVFFIQQYW
jgi:hypothetical protein